MFFQLHRTFPQGSNYWGANLSQVEMSFMGIIKKKNQQKIMEDFRRFKNFFSYARSKEDTNTKNFFVAFIHPKNAFAD